MPITVRLLPDNHMSRKRSLPAANESVHIPANGSAAVNDGSIPIAKRLHIEGSCLGNGDSNQHNSVNGRLLGVLPNGVHIRQLHLNGHNVPTTVQRKASVNTQAALLDQLLIDDSPPASPPSVKSGREVKTEARSTSANDLYTDSDSTTSRHVNGHTSTLTPKITFEDESAPQLDDSHNDSESLDTTPVSSPFHRLSPQRLFEVATEGEGLTLSEFYQKGKLKQPEIHLVKHQSKNQRNQHARKHKPKSKLVNNHSSLYHTNVLQGGYVKRMASLNAAACVSAMMEPQKKSTMRHNDTTISKSIGQLHVAASNSKVVQRVPEKHQIDHRQSLCLLQPTDGITTAYTGDPDDRLIDVIEPLTSPLSLSELENTTEEENEMAIMSAAPAAPEKPCSLEDLQYVSIGLLHNGSTIHPDTRVFYKSDKNLRLSFPKIITPVLVPSKMENVRRAIECASTIGVRKAAKKKTRKRNNGWYPMGDPIKSILIKKGATKVIRKYYSGIKRRHERIFVRDSVAVSSGDLEHSKPYVAKVASIWQETDHSGLMVTLFWYYRPTEVDLNKTTSSSGVVAPEFYEREILASQHHDDNSVACIEEKCYVLGLQQYCRYIAAIKSNFCFGVKSVVPELSAAWPPCRDTQTHQLQAATKVAGQQFSTSSNIEFDDDSQECTDHTKSSNIDALIFGSTPQLLELCNVDQNLVYLCYRGYNHIAGKLSNKSRTAAK